MIKYGYKFRKIMGTRNFGKIGDSLEWLFMGKIKAFDPIKRSPKVPDFDILEDGDIKRHSIFWTPRFYQASSLSPEFLKEIRKFRKIRQFKNEHVFALTQLILIEAIRDTTFDYSFNYKASPSFVSLFHGTIDCLLFQKYDLDPGSIGAPFVPILFPKELYQKNMDFIQEIYSPQRIVSTGLWCRAHMNYIDPDLTFCRALYTNGHQWSLYEIHDNFIKKTPFFEPRKITKLDDTGKNYGHNADFPLYAPRFFDDYEHMLSVIGLIRFALCIRENIVEHAENIELLEQDQNKIVGKNTLLRRQDNQVFKQIPFERKEVPPALEPGREEYIKLDNKPSMKQIDQTKEDK